MRHLSGSNSITALTEAREVLESVEFAAAQRFVATELPDLIKDPQISYQLEHALPMPERLRPVTIVGNFFEALGSFVRHDIIDKEVAISLWSSVVIQTWDRLTPALAIMRRSSGPSLWEQFEYLARISQDWVAAHPHGSYPPGVAHMPVPDAWIAEDTKSVSAAQSAESSAFASSTTSPTNK